MSEPTSTPQPTPARSVPGPKSLPASPRTKEQLAADAALKRAQARKEAQRVKKFEQADQGQQWYMLCSACDMPGLMLVRHFDAGDGARVYHWTEWFATYKALEQPYMSHNYPCQHCKKNLPLSPTSEYGQFEIEDSQTQWVDSDEARAARQSKSDAEVAHYQDTRDAATRIQLVRGGGA